jgi:VWFA-related protein
LRFSLFNVQAASALAPIDDFVNTPGEQFLEQTFAESSIRRIADAIAAVREIPGRKSVVLVSEGFTVFGAGMDNAAIRDLLRRLVDRSNRAGVVIYGLDPRGLVSTGLTAADRVRGGGAAVMAARSAALRESQDGLRYVANETGGFAVINSNDLARGFGRIMADQRGYYLIGYQPEAGTLHARSDVQYKRLKIKVKTKGLTIRTRSGFYARATQ